MNFDQIAEKVRMYLEKSDISVKDNYWYRFEKDEFIDMTMSCDKYEIVEYAKRILTNIVKEGTKDRPWNRLAIYARWLAIYDIYKSVLAD